MSFLTIFQLGVKVITSTPSFLNVFTLNTPEVFISSVQNKFDSEGNLIDDKTAEVIVKQLNAFIELIERVKA